MARPRSDIRPRIVHAARARFLIDGVDGASLRQIAREARTNLGMIVYYFPAKDDLFLAVVEEVYPRLLEQLAQALGGAGSTRDRLYRAFVGLGQLTDDELAVVRLIVREALGSSRRLELVLARAKRGHVALLLDALAQGVAAGELDGSLPLPMALISTFALGALPQFLRRAKGEALLALPESEPLAKLSVELLFRAIGPPAKPPNRPAPKSRTRKRVAAAR
ncbi:MAG: transcriptional regulator, TetR family [Deltaproteobacteria bacterium]|nr:transcriptional regulator, TetR family [Deltaproteobacteria bacterium]